MRKNSAKSFFYENDEEGATMGTVINIYREPCLKEQKYIAKMPHKSDLKSIIKLFKMQIVIFLPCKLWQINVLI